MALLLGCGIAEEDGAALRPKDPPPRIAIAECKVACFMVLVLLGRGGMCPCGGALGEKRTHKLCLLTLLPFGEGWARTAQKG